MSTHDHQQKTIEIELSREHTRLKVGIFTKTNIEEDTLRHISEQTIDPYLITNKCKEFTRLLNNANLRGALAGENLAQLKNTGFSLFEDLLPHNVQKELSKTASENLIINIDDGLVHIPWELLYDGSDFLCRKFNVGRVVRTHQNIVKPKPKKISSPLKILILCDPSGDLENAYIEGSLIRSELDKSPALIHADLFNRRVNNSTLRDYIRNYDIIHYAGHADYVAADPSQSGWLLENGKFTSHDIMHMSRNRPFPNLIFANACQSGQTLEWKLNEDFETNIFGLAHSFLVSGVLHYIGTFWEVLDDASREFSVCFYQKLIQGCCIGEAVKKSREHLISIYGESNIIWASYVLYGHPSFNYLDDNQFSSADKKLPYEEMSTHKEALATGSTRSLPLDRKTFNFTISSVIIFLTAIFILLFLSHDKLPFLKQKHTDKTSITAVKSVKPSTDNIRVILKALTEKYEKQKKIKGSSHPVDSWTSSPLTMSILGFSCVGNIKDSENLEQYFTTSLSRELINTGRVQLVEREKINALLKELQISTSDIADQSLALAMLGKLMGARLIGVGKIVKLKNLTTVNLRVFETDTSKIIIALHEELDNRAAKVIVNNLSNSLIKEARSLYPVKGKIIRLQNEKVLLNIGADSGVQVGTDFSILPTNDSLAESDLSLAYDKEHIGLLKTVQTMPDHSYATILSSKKNIVPGLRVVESN